MKLNIKLLPLIPLAMAAYVVSASTAGAVVTTALRVGVTPNGLWGIQNTSVTAQLTQVSIFLPNTTFFDSTSTPPGVSATGWGTLAATGGAFANYPSDASTDGQTYAVISFGSFDPGDSINFQVDLDQFASPDGIGAPLGTLIAASFSDGSNEFDVISAIPNTINGQSYDYGISVPEPTSLLLGASALGIFASRRRRA